MNQKKLVSTIGFLALLAVFFVMITSESFIDKSNYLVFDIIGILLGLGLFLILFISTARLLISRKKEKNKGLAIAILVIALIGVGVYNLGILNIISQEGIILKSTNEFCGVRITRGKSTTLYMRTLNEKMQIIEIKISNHLYDSLVNTYGNPTGCIKIPIFVYYENVYSVAVGMSSLL